MPFNQESVLTMLEHRVPQFPSELAKLKLLESHKFLVVLGEDVSKRNSDRWKIKISSWRSFRTNFKIRLDVMARGRCQILLGICLLCTSVYKNGQRHEDNYTLFSIVLIRGNVTSILSNFPTGKWPWRFFSCCDIICVYINEFSVLLFVDKFNWSPPLLISLCQHRVLIILEVIDSTAYEIRLKLG